MTLDVHNPTHQPEDIARQSGWTESCWADFYFLTLEPLELAHLR